MAPLDVRASAGLWLLITLAARSPSRSTPRPPQAPTLARAAAAARLIF